VCRQPVPRDAEALTQCDGHAGDTCRSDLARSLLVITPDSRGSTIRKFVFTTAIVASLAGAGVALAGQAATDSTGRFIDLNVAVTPPIAGTAKHPQGVGVSFDSFTGNRSNGSLPSNNSTIVVRFNKGFQENGSQFPACTINTAPSGMSSCAKSTQIGAGTAEARLLAAPTPTFVPATLQAFNGKPLSGKTPTVIFIASIGGKPSAELDFTVKQQPTGPYGLAFTSITFPNTPPATFDITKFSVKFPDKTVKHKAHGKTVRVHLITAPTTCHGAWAYAQTNGYTDGSTLTATDSQPCVK
jgi:hypothetical protein